MFYQLNTLGNIRYKNRNKLFILVFKEELKGNEIKETWN